MKSFKYALFLMVGLTCFTPKLYAEDLNQLPLSILKQRMDHGDQEAKLKYYEILRRKYEGKSISEVKQMANQGDGRAASIIGADYEYGANGVPKDYFKAKEWFEKGVKYGDEVALMNLASLYENGNGVPQDIDKAIEYYKQAANKGNLDAYTSIASIYDDDQYGREDKSKAKEWYEKAANRGSGLSSIIVGDMYARGVGTAPDKAKAKEYFKQACLKKEEKGCSFYKELNH